MGARVKQGVGTVYVTDDGGERHAFGAGQDVPEWAKAKMGDVIEDAQPAAPAHEGQSSETDDRPPKGGAGSGLDAWRAFAEAHGFDVAHDATREDIIAAVEAADS